MRTIVALAAFGSLWIASPVALTGLITGDVFIVTRGGPSIKLGLVTVNAIPAATVETHVSQKKLQADGETSKLIAAINKLDVLHAEASAESDRREKIYHEGIMNDGKLRDWRDAAKTRDELDRQLGGLREQKEFFRSGDFYFEGLPPVIATAKTDADGKFSFRIPRTGKFAIVARASRLAGNSTENYYWIVWTSLGGQASKHLMLSNDNMLGQGSADSALK